MGGNQGAPKGDGEGAMRGKRGDWGREGRRVERGSLQKERVEGLINLLNYRIAPRTINGTIHVRQRPTLETDGPS